MPPIADVAGVSVFNGNCLDVLKDFPDSHFDAVVTDPPYGISFMGKKWDYEVPSVEVWEQVIRCLKPGGHLLCACGTRTQHRMAVNIEDAGFEIRDVILWLYGSGFPKSLDVGKAIDKFAGAERQVVSTGKPVKRMIPGADQNANGSWIKDNGREFVPTETAPATDEAKQWDGWGTALKPACELFTLARKPLVGTVAQNVLKHGTGGLNIDGCRIELNGDYKCKANGRPSQTGLGDNYSPENANQADTVGRWPANVIHDGSDEVLERFPHTESGVPSGVKAGGSLNVFGKYAGGIPVTGFGDSGSASRFFYCAKADKVDRGPGNNHPTVKPTDLMRHLIRLVCPIGGIILDPFAGSGSTGVAAVSEFVRCVLIELDKHNCEIIVGRIDQPALPFEA